ncbi:capcid protein VP1-like [Alphaentomopoxvirus acuprea]|uniref:Capcid protein VP1-like n=1 Tax=Alphaentomopoxvirus acuprea TaxID=62099 RepID=W6JIY5_9POXV|nr:capcid protein VP1-like [Anomala cuprea entomopoxvirus]BAO49532.1 capcid protein VP1-like [Anomala cuprea entomopoxvirus]
MECANCKNFILHTYDLEIDTTKNIYLIVYCNKCHKKTRKHLSYGKSKLLKKQKGLHLLNYNYCGPFTNVIKNIINDIKPFNDLDNQCRLHDINYHLFKDNKQRVIADINLLSYISNMNNRSINSDIIKIILKFKVYLQYSIFKKII